MHVIQRGNNRGACFRARSDYLVYLLHLHELAKKFVCSVHAYCLMPNHVHLLVTPSSEDGCMAMMRDLGQRYVPYFNRRHGRTGTLWEGRYRSSLVESARYVLACYRYIELNPVRAALVERPDAFEWSSHRGNTGQHSDSLLTPHAELTALGAGKDGYLALFEEALEPALLREIREATNAGYPLGSDAFKTAVVAPTGHKLAPGKSGRPAREASDEAQSGSEPDLLFRL
ncbi:MAG TPA: transposase [Burkholderiales bacterium]|nr:transposase [Burkholderiales bacterium]